MTNVKIDIKIEGLNLEGIVEDKGSHMYIEMRKPFSNPWAYVEKEEGVEYISNNNLTPKGLELSSSTLGKIYNGCQFISDNFEDIKENYISYFKEAHNNLNSPKILSIDEFDAKEEELRFLYKSGIIDEKQYSIENNEFKDENEAFMKIKHDAVGKIVEYVREKYQRRVNMGFQITMDAFNMDTLALTEIRK